ncbi:tetratricopeptide repeat protein [Streptomyces sp. NPDC049954]|uniref:AfsR/SARP family transcriptional regulator n=1 Tax=Streptomyces sp. NPDC049954 TaxID=3155779 RepID=UPI00343E1790
MEFEIRLSGSVEIRTADSRHALGPPKTRLTLAVLAWEAGNTVGVESLVRRVWGEDPPLKAREALHSHVSRVRRALRECRLDPSVIVSRGNAYLLAVEPDQVDLHRYTDLVRRARALSRGGAGAEAWQVLDRADALWRGEPLAGMDTDWVQRLRAAVGDARTGALGLRAATLMRAGRYEEAVPLLAPLLEDRPVDESLVAQYALALHGSGRTGEAASVLRSARQRVVRRTGIDIGERLTATHSGVLAGVPAADLLDPGAERTSRRRAGCPDNLPRDVSWVGRREEVRRLTAALSPKAGKAGPVVTVEALGGMGGLGKTALALHVFHQLRDRFPDGRLYVNLRGHTPGHAPLAPEQALTELLRLLEFPAERIPHRRDELVALWRTVLRERRIAVLLDDASGPEQVRELLPGDSPAAVVVTSRQRLNGLTGVRHLTLPPLPQEEGAALFLHRVGLERDAWKPEVQRVVRLCAGLPLAIELVSSRLLSHPSWRVSDLLDQLLSGPDRLAELRDGEKTITQVIASSYRALTPLQRLVFRRVGMHFGSEFGPEAVAALADLPVATSERLIEELLVRNMIIEPSPHRYGMHDLLRSYARLLVGTDGAIRAEVEGLAEVDTEAEARQARLRLVDHYLRSADHADRSAYAFRVRIPVPDAPSGARDAYGPEGPDAATEWFVREGANLLGALEWLRANGSDAQLALFVHVLSGFLDGEGYLATAEPVQRAAVTYWLAAGEASAAAAALLDLSVVCAHRGEYRDARRAALGALSVARARDLPLVEAEALHQLAMALWYMGKFGYAHTFSERALRIRLRLGDALQLARSHNLMGILHLHVGNDQQAVEYFLLAISGFTGEGDRRGLYRSLNNIAELYQRIGRSQAAERAYRQAIKLLDSGSGRGDSATLHLNLATVLTTLGEPEEALSLLERALPALRGVGDARGEALVLNGLGRALRGAGRYVEAVPRHLASLALLRQLRARGDEASVLYDLGRTEQAMGQVRAAAERLRQSLEISNSLGSRAEAAHTLRALRALAADEALPDQD